jgi:hypothetical protein
MLFHSGVAVSGSTHQPALELTFRLRDLVHTCHVSLCIAKATITDRFIGPRIGALGIDRKHLGIHEDGLLKPGQIGTAVCLLKERLLVARLEGDSGIKASNRFFVQAQAVQSPSLPIMSFRTARILLKYAVKTPYRLPILLAVEELCALNEERLGAGSKDPLPDGISKTWHYLF